MPSITLIYRTIKELWAYTHGGDRIFIAYAIAATAALWGIFWVFHI